jgi:hypothetical protein
MALLANRIVVALTLLSFDENYFPVFTPSLF